MSGVDKSVFVDIKMKMLAHGVQQLLTHNVQDFQRYQDRIEILPLLQQSA